MSISRHKITMGTKSKLTQREREKERERERCERCLVAGDWKIRVDRRKPMQSDGHFVAHYQCVAFGEVCRRTGLARLCTRHGYNWMKLHARIPHQQQSYLRSMLQWRRKCTLIFLILRWTYKIFLIRKYEAQKNIIVVIIIFIYCCYVK